MDFVQAMPNYFEEISKDVDYLARTKADEKGRNYLIVSVALRALGGFLAFMTVKSIVACFLTPMTILSSLASVIVAFVIARDLIKIGNNMRASFQGDRTSDDDLGDKKSFFSFDWDMGKGKVGAVPADFNETFIPRYMFGIWMYAKTALSPKTV